jgi:AAA+ ATPase superfamily predicted ATPase
MNQKKAVPLQRNYHNYNNYMNNNSINPFVIGKYLSDEYFCDREQETEFLKKQILNGRNVTLIADRRIGKSGLISHVFAQPEMQKQFYTIIVDLYATGSLTEMVYAFSKEVYRSVKQQSQSWQDKFFQVISSLRVGFKLDPVSGSPAFDIGFGDITAPEMTLEQVFAFLETSDKPCIVAFDEFQQITNYPEKNIEALLRTHIQRCKKTQFIFSGSRKHMMSQMFLSPSKPFYQSTINMGLEPIPRETYIDFAKRMFLLGDKQIANEAVEQVYDRCRGITWYMQMLLNEMFALTKIGEECKADVLAEALNNVVQVQEPFYREILAALPIKQKTLLYALVKENGAENITSSAFVQKHKLISSSSVQSAMKGLCEKDIVIESDGIWRIYDVFFSQYLLNK